MLRSAADISLDRMVSAVEKVRQRLVRATTALRVAKIPYAVAGGNAVAAWVSSVDEAAVRNTQDVDLLVRREDLPAIKTAMESAGFVHRHAAGIDVFLDGPNAKPREAVHIVFAGEKVKPHESAANPDVTQSHDTGVFRVLELEALVRIKLTANRDKDRTHLRDLIEVGLIDRSWIGRFPGDLGSRLKDMLDHPEG
ncbi:MAG: hypothetical protein ABIP55_16560 [Tepidisphaeraceae bacterium]